MAKIETPRILIPITKEKIKSLDDVPKKNVLFFAGGYFSEGELYVFGAPTKISNPKEEGFWICPKGLKKLGWHVSSAPQNENDLEEHLSEVLIMLKLKDMKERNYNIDCSAIPLGMSVLYGDSYLLDFTRKRDLKKALDFGAREMLGVKGFGNFSETEIKKLSDFLYEDFQTQKHTKGFGKIC